MEERVQKAMENHKKGYNCCQAVACAYADLVGVDEETMFRIAEGFGAGMGGLEGVCGAISGAVMLAGLKTSTCNLESPNSKGKTYLESKEILERFKEMNQSIICKELKGIETKKILRTCSGCIYDAAQIAKEMFEMEAE
ncbi:MAG: C_GCAxxG_C_C family protein [Lachnospiraceae bacterium]|nr:C_GCAxxG_C_C family protein [Lachnospiraceae bacterium]